MVATPNAAGSFTFSASVSGPDPDSDPANESTSQTLTVVPFSPCDILQKGNTNVADVQAIINEALGVAPVVNDLNGDGVVNVADAQIVINAALGLGCAAH